MARIRTFMVERWMSTYENDIPLNLAESSIKQLTLNELLDLAEEAGDAGIRRRMGEVVLTYDETRGTQELREAIAAYYPGAGPDNVLVTNGAIEANYLLFNTLVSPGDTVITMFPAYQQLYSVAEALGAHLKRWELKLEKGYVPDLDDLDRLIDRNTRLIVINTPHNPTGSVLSEDQVKGVIERARGVGARVMSDETYYGLSLSDEQTLSRPVYELDQEMLSVGTTSKNIGLAGLRIGWIVADPDTVQRAWAYRDYTSISSGRLSDFLAMAAIRMRPTLLTRARRIARQNFALLDQFMSTHEEYFHYAPPRAGLLTFPALRPRVLSKMDSETFCKRLIGEEGVMLVPGEAFEKPGHVRIGYGDDSHHLAQGLELMRSFLTRHFG